MLSTVVVSVRSVWVTMRLAMSTADRPCILPDDADHRDINVRENIGGCIENRKRTEDQQQERENGESVGPP